MLAGPVLDRAHRFAGPLVVHIDVGAHARIGRVLLLVRIEAVVVALVLARDVVRQFVELQALAPHLVLVDWRAEAGEDRVPVMSGVVDWHVPLRDRHLARHRNHEGMREYQIGDAHMRAGVADLPQGDDAHAVVGRLDLDLRARMLTHDPGHRHVGVDRMIAEQLAVTLRHVLVLEEAVQKRGMRRIDADFERLQPVAVDHALEREGVGRGRDEAVEVRQRGRLAAAHIREQDAALLDHRVGLLTDVGAHSAAFRLGRRLQALAGDVEQPAVECAAQPAVLQPAIGQIGTAMRAAALNQAVAALVVAEHHEVFAEQAHRLDRPVAGELIDERGGLPVAPHQHARRRIGSGPGDQIILLGAQHGIVPSRLPATERDFTGRLGQRASLAAGGTCSPLLALFHVRHMGERQCTKRTDIRLNLPSKPAPAISIILCWSCSA